MVSANSLPISRWVDLRSTKLSRDSTPKWEIAHEVSIQTTNIVDGGNPAQGIDGFEIIDGVLTIVGGAEFPPSTIVRVVNGTWCQLLQNQ